MTHEINEALQVLQRVINERMTISGLDTICVKKVRGAEGDVNNQARILFQCFQQELSTVSGNQVVDEETITAVRNALTKSVSCVSVWPECKLVVKERLDSFETIVLHHKSVVKVYAGANSDVIKALLLAI